jgi:hypothetical protein
MFEKIDKFTSRFLMIIRNIPKIISPFTYRGGCDCMVVGFTTAYHH